jgi:hypothetical protein
MMHTDSDGQEWTVVEFATVGGGSAPEGGEISSVETAVVMFIAGDKCRIAGRAPLTWRTDVARLFLSAR